MNVGKIAAGALVVTGVAAGALMYWLQVYAFYAPVAFTKGDEIHLTPLGAEKSEAIIADNVTGIDADSSPIKFRACFTTPMSLSMLTETYQPYADPLPLNAPDWFDCFDNAAIDAGLESGEALAFLSQAEIRPGVDRVVAVFPDGRAFAWQQFNACGDAVFNRKDLPPGCDQSLYYPDTPAAEEP